MANVEPLSVFADLYADGKGILYLLDVRDDDYLLEFVLDGLDRFRQALLPGAVLRAEAFVDEQHGQGGARAVRQQPGQRYSQRKVDAKRFAAAERLITARAKRIRNPNLQSLRCAFIQLKAQVHAMLCDAPKYGVGVILQLRYGALYDQRLDAVLAECQRQFVVDALFVRKLSMPQIQRAYLAVKPIAVGELLFVYGLVQFGLTQRLFKAIAACYRIVQRRLDFGKRRQFLAQRGCALCGGGDFGVAV